jgi:hypothetical protein
MNQAFLDYYRCPASFVDFRLLEGQPNGHRPGYFKFGSGLVCYGAGGVPGQEHASDSLSDALAQVRIEEPTCFLPFDLADIVNNLRYERYLNGGRGTPWKRALRRAYYALRPGLPVFVRRHLQRISLNGWKDKTFPRWPVDGTVDQLFRRLMGLTLRSSRQARIPFVWFWPAGKPSCAIVTHDVETISGLKSTRELMDLNDRFGIKTSFQIIPEARYIVTDEVLSAIRKRGFEINVHDLKHDGHLFEDHEQFLNAAARINSHARRFGSRGFRSGALYRNQDWYGAFSFSYDMSVPNVAHLDPQPGGCCTVLPYFVDHVLELPVTTTQDYSLFNILGTYSLDLWQEQIRQIMGQNGLISFIVHPDYLDSTAAKDSYAGLLQHLADLRSEKGLWTALPGEVDFWWRQRSKMKLVQDGTQWRVVGDGAERAVVAYATLKDNAIEYSLS